MDKLLIIVCAVVGSLGVLSAIFGFSAEGTKLTPYDIIPFDGECFYPQNPALGLGISATIFLLAAQVTFTAVGGCCGCCGKSSRSNPSPSETKRIVGIVCAVVSWIAAVIAFALFIDGAALNANGVRVADPYCTCLKDGIFAGAGVLSLAATVLGVASYVLTRTQRVKAAAAAAPPVVPVEGEPKLPPAATQDNGSPRTNQEVHRPPADTATAAMPSAPPVPAGEPTAPPAAEMSQQPPPVQLLQVGAGVPNDTIQYPIQQQQGSDGQLIRRELTKAGIRLAERLVEHTLFSDNIATPATLPGVGDILVSMTDLQSTDAAV